MTSDKYIKIKAPSSKSLSHRALIAGALSEGTTVVLDPLDSNDINRTMDCLSTMGAKFHVDAGTTNVTGMTSGPKGGQKEPEILEMRDSGTTCRLITALAGAGKGLFRIQGTPRMHDRPIGALTDALESQGVKVTFSDKDGYPPVTLEADGFSGREMDISLEESSQYLSGLLLAAPLAHETAIINVVGKKAVSWPYVALTLNVMEDFRVSFEVETMQDGTWTKADWRMVEKVIPGEIRFRVNPSPYQRDEYRVEGDWSNASYFLAAGAVGNKAVKIEGLSTDSLQGDRAIMGILESMGARIESDSSGVIVHPSKLHGVEVDMGLCPDLVPTVAVAAAFADSPTTITNVAHLRIKECDRLEASAAEVMRAGGKAEMTDDSITIIPGRLKKTERIVFSTYDDHRLAMSTAIFSLAGIEAIPEEPGCVNKSFPGFWDEWAKVTKGNGC
ncbi:3-phosphoshikimate 1-carboxyvinyltransferase [Maridesulfovibrio hydrothermalis]|uniref:3-phosphoshikimate 1-carboxyvinyltransferase n=1 Tax=Maridesulfovibrio hydrothermalis AM13 = DSM 14728 TaxID=1121451 RepID=L0RAM7_9BACT|nr:3-phosphoshikimate 1-carboxyvinyltransferase [Maridesulfovibrio hydrothermalis]CCO23828.1 3-phosphoshikimate 1-carboxyvinyltransferase [Maridesulfovibrio hydrothermalis AM13 = DSM 14728]